MKKKRKQNDFGNIDGSWTLPTVVAISGAVNKKAKDKNSLSKKKHKRIYQKWPIWNELKFNEFLRQSIFLWKKINRLGIQFPHQVIETKIWTNQRAYFLRTVFLN